MTDSVSMPPFTAVSVPEYNLTGEFCRKHFLTGLLLRELGLALQDEQDLRHLALATLKNLMAKHSLDARYATKVDFFFCGRKCEAMTVSHEDTAEVLPL